MLWQFTSGFVLKVNKYFSKISYKKEIEARAADSTWWPGIYVLAVVGLSFRIVFALTSDRIHHPDEVFQYLEQAHRIIFGYGYVPWEYRFGARSWILPGFISIWLLVCKFLHVDYPSVYIPLVKIVFSLLSISLIFSAYIIGRNLASERAGRLAAFFTCFWYELIYFSHKPLPDIVSTYFLVGALACTVMKGGHCRPLLLGFLSALCIAIRMQNLLAVGFILLFVLLMWGQRDLVEFGSSFVVTIAFAGYVDFLTWGAFFHLLLS
jgi:phosphatidylinositol glycan class B